MANLAAIDPLLLAQECLDELELDQSRPIDVLEALARLDLTTTVVDLGDVLGVVVPQGGVMLSSQRGETVQRYTAAHEIGHWIMHRRSLLVDTQQDINGEPTSQRERQAQLFGSYFLMPPPLLMDALARHELTPDHVEASQVYLLARDLRVSYEAALVRLRTERYLTQEQARMMRGLGRAKARAQAFEGRRPENGFADLWSVGMADATHLEVTVGDEIVVQLPENRTTPYRWQTPATLVEPPLSPARRPTIPSSEHTLGRPDRPAAATAPVAATSAARQAALRLVPDRGTAVGGDRGHGPVVAADGALAVTADAFRLDDGQRAPSDLRARRRAVGTTNEDQSVVASAGVATAAFGERLLQVQCREEGEHALLLRYVHAFSPDLPPAATWELIIDIAPSLTTRQRRRLLAVDLDARRPGDPSDDAVFG